MSAFNKSRAEGRAGETVIRRMFAADFTITQASEAEDRMGVDLWFERAGIRIGVQVKQDTVAAKTRNLFIETVSVDMPRRDGWAVDPLADVLLYLIPPSLAVYVIPMRLIRQNLKRWRERYPERSTAPSLNDGYRTRGICVPLTEFAACRLLTLPAGEVQR